MTDLERLCKQIRDRSCANRRAMELMHREWIWSQVIGILRQELSSMVCVIHLLSIDDLTYRRQLISDSVNGRAWTANDKKSPITNRDIDELTQKLQGWTRSVFKFGHAFIYLSPYHDLKNRDALWAGHSLSEKDELLAHLRAYHGGPDMPNSALSDIYPYLPRAFGEISNTLESKLERLEDEHRPPHDDL